MTLWTAITLAALTPGTLRAQAGSPGGAPRFSGFDFLMVRYAGGGSVSVYAGYRAGPGMAVVGIVENPVSGRRGVVAGPGTRLRLGTRQGVMVVLAAAESGGETSLRLYALPALRLGALRVSATAVASEPIRGGARELSLSPVTVTTAVRRDVSAGFAAAVTIAGGGGSRVSVGPVLGLRLPIGVVAAEALVVSAPAGGAEARLAYSATF